MIISASRRTDLPAFYSSWFINRIRAGFCTVPNPFNPHQVAHISLKPEDVEVIVFWTRNPRPLFPYLDELDKGGYGYYFQYTLTGYPRELETHTPSLEAAVQTFRQLVERVGSRRVIWRYDPIVLGQLTPPDFHRRRFKEIAQALRGCTHRSVISLLDVYPKLKKRLEKAQRMDLGLLPIDETQPLIGELISDLVEVADQNQMELVSCAEELDLSPYDVRPGKCIDDGLIFDLFGIQVSHEKDPGQRKACGCVVSKDIGMYGSCLFGCQYCYAVSSFRRARINYEHHDPESTSLVI